MKIFSTVFDSYTSGQAVDISFDFQKRRGKTRLFYLEIIFVKEDSKEYIYQARKKLRAFVNFSPKK